MHDPVAFGELADGIRAAGPGQSFDERIGSARMVSAPPTPYLEAVLRRVERAVRTATPYAPRTLAHEPMVIGDRYLVVPDLTVWRHGAADDAVPDLVIELRSDSTDRYALGIKRLAYQTARIPEYWFVDPRGGVVHRMRLVDGGAPEYRWPPEEARPGDVLRASALGGAAVAVVDLLSPTQAAA